MLLGNFGRRKGSKNKFRKAKPGIMYTRLQAMGMSNLADDLVSTNPKMDLDTASKYTLESLSTYDQAGLDRVNKKYNKYFGR